MREIAGKRDRIAGLFDSDDTPPAAEWHAGLKTAKIVIANHLHEGTARPARKPKWKPWLTIQKLIQFAILVAVAAMPMNGQGNYEIQGYGSDTVAPGRTMVELHSNFIHLLIPPGSRNQKSCCIAASLVWNGVRLVGPRCTSSVLRGGKGCTT